jgi:hypothetical protein
MPRPDITTNEMPEGRLVVILLDQSTRLGTPTVHARELAKAAVNALAPDDLAAVIHTNQGPPQNLTDDRTRLLAAIDGGALGMNPPEGDSNFGRGECGCGICSLDAITIVADALRGAPDRPKSLLFIGEGIALEGHVQPVCRIEARAAAERMLRATHAAHLTVHTLDPNGLQTTSVSADVVVESSATAAPPEPVTVTWRIRDQAGESVGERIEEVPASRFESEGFAEATLDVPLGAIGPGTYVLLAEATRGGTTAIRELVFSVK